MSVYTQTYMYMYVRATINYINSYFLIDKNCLISLTNDKFSCYEFRKVNAHYIQNYFQNFGAEI